MHEGPNSCKQCSAPFLCRFACVYRALWNSLSPAHVAFVSLIRPHAVCGPPPRVCHVGAAGGGCAAQVAGPRQRWMMLSGVIRKSDIHCCGLQCHGGGVRVWRRQPTGPLPGVVHARDTGWDRWSLLTLILRISVFSEQKSRFFSG